MHMWSANACGNTFLILFDEGGADWFIKNLRRTGGWTFDTALVLKEAQGERVNMKIFERDGSESAMCGNGARAVARVLDLLNHKKEVCVADHVVPIERTSSERYRVAMGRVERKTVFPNYLRNQNLDLFNGYSVGGEPHAVAIVPNVWSAPLIELGQMIVPAANCTIAAMKDKGLIEARTFERGVNAETQSCGTGACAAAQAIKDAGLLPDKRSSVKVRMNSHILQVRFEQENVILEGPADITGYSRDMR